MCMEEKVFCEDKLNPNIVLHTYEFYIIFCLKKDIKKGVCLFKYLRTDNRISNLKIVVFNP